MIAINRILCPTDLSPVSRLALEEAVALARWYEAEVTVLYVSPFLVSVGSEVAYIPGPLPLTPEDRERLRADLRAFVDPLRGEGGTVRLELAEGDPATEILAFARERGADLVVMGTHGRHGLDLLVVGSVTERILREAPCPVLTVAGRGRPSGAGFATIVCPLDFSPASAHTAREAALLAQERQARLVLVHVLEGSAYPPTRVPPGFDRHAYQAEVEQDAAHRLRSLLPEGVPAQTRVPWGHADQEILRIAREEEAGLVVMGAHGGPLDSPLFGSTAHKVVRAAPCPVLVLRARAAVFEEKAPETVGVARGVE